MNNQRRAEIAAMIEQLESLASEAGRIKDDEQEYFDHMPDSIQDGKRGQKVEEAIDLLERAEESIREAIEQMQEAV